MKRILIALLALAWFGSVRAEPVPMHGYGQSLALTLPPLAVVVLELEHAAAG